MQEYYLNNKEKMNDQSAANYESNREERMAGMKEYYEENKEQILEWQEAYRKETDAWRVFKENHPEAYKAHLLSNRKRLKNATPKCLSKQHKSEICIIYQTRPEGYHVDHIVPLRGKDVCGLHVPWNLQHLPAKENLKWSNKVKEL
jgi:hypothetical protein